MESWQVGGCRFLTVGARTRRFEHRVEVVVEQVSNVAWIRGGKSRIKTSLRYFVWNAGLLESRIAKMCCTSKWSEPKFVAVFSVLLNNTCWNHTLN